MTILGIITKKKNALALSYDELKYAFMGYLNNEIPDYQMSALLMAITINGMNLSETLSLTDIFIRSGKAYDFSGAFRYTVDKHSTGGVGDTTTLIVGPMCAALGLHMAKISGRGLGLTGGTIDKVESIPGFNFQLDEEEFYTKVEEVGFALSSQTAEIAPLDKVVYALRDVTGTTESLPLIASSIMSKKIAAGADNILIDIKVGEATLIKTMEEAKTLSNWLTAIGEAYKKNVRTIINKVESPLSYAIGNSLEICEVINVLNGKKCPLYYACIEITAHLLNMTKNIDFEEAEIRAEQVLKNGEALKKFHEFVKNQGGRLREVKVANTVIPLKARHSGTITKMDALGIAKLAAKLGASKDRLEDQIDHSVGILLNCKVGDKIKENDVILKIYANKKIEFKENDFDFIEIN